VTRVGPRNPLLQIGNPLKISPVILCGGSGTRLWPLSRSTYPKQFLRLTGEYTMLQETLRRLAGLSEITPPIVICNQEHRFLVADSSERSASRRSLLLLEPTGRNTAPAVAAAAVALSKDEPDSAMLVLPSDHAIQDTGAFHRAIRTPHWPPARAPRDVRHHSHAPETGYGYIRRAETLPGLDNTFAISRFVEKPDLEDRTGLSRHGRLFLEQRHVPYEGCDLSSGTRGVPACDSRCRTQGARHEARWTWISAASTNRRFAESPSISIDYAVMENTKLGAVVPVEMGWSDVGSWDALWDLHEKTAAGNVLQGDVLASDVSNTFIKAENRMVAAVVSTTSSSSKPRMPCSCPHASPRRT